MLPMRALVLHNDSFQVQEIDQPKPDPSYALVRLNYAALNHRDQWIREGKYAKIELPAVLGSDGMGVVESVGNEGENGWIGKSVIINPNINWGHDAGYQDMKNYEILGMPSQGTLAEYIVVHTDRLHLKPEYLSDAEAAALPLAGLTAYNALMNKGHAHEDMNILISGVGGGVAQMAFQYALALGAKVWVTSSKSDVLDQCVKMGASGRNNYKRPDYHKELARESGGFDVIIDSAGGDGMNSLLSTLKPGGRYVFYGATNGIPSNLNLRMMFWKQLSIKGSTMGSDQDFSHMLTFVDHHKIKPLIDKVFPLSDAVEAFDRMKAGFQFGKIVVSLRDS